jgi:hypothetical protein
MSIAKAIERAYKVARDRRWDTIYWAVDLHGVCMTSNYESGVHEFISQEAVDTLRFLSLLPETKIILWSSVHEDQKVPIINTFEDQGIMVHHFNRNPYEANTATGCFDEKFYFSILLDDKAGFDPQTDWAVVRQAVLAVKEGR